MTYKFEGLEEDYLKEDELEFTELDMDLLDVDFLQDLLEILEEKDLLERDRTGGDFGQVSIEELFLDLIKILNIIL